MSILGEYFRLPPADLKRAIDDPDWALDHITRTLDADPESPRHFSTDKTWHLLDFLLRRHGFPVDVIHGEEPLGAAGSWGYGPPRHLPPARVRLAADTLRTLPYGRLVSGVTPEELNAAEIYPSGWDEAPLDWAHDWYTGLTSYLATAADHKEAVLIWHD